MERECEVFYLCETWEVFCLFVLLHYYVGLQEWTSHLHCCISNYKFALLHWLVGESYTCYVVMLLHLNYWLQHFWAFGCCIVIFCISIYWVFLSYFVFSIDLVFFPWGCLWTLYVKFNRSRFCKSFGSCKLFVSSFIFWFCAGLYFWPCN